MAISKKELFEQQIEKITKLGFGDEVVGRFKRKIEEVTNASETLVLPQGSGKPILFVPVVPNNLIPVAWQIEACLAAGSKLVYNQPLISRFNHPYWLVGVGRGGNFRREPEALDFFTRNHLWSLTVEEAVALLIHANPFYMADICMRFPKAATNGKTLFVTKLGRAFEISAEGFPPESNLAPIPFSLGITVEA